MADYTDLEKRGISIGPNVRLAGRNIFETPSRLFGGNYVIDSSLGAHSSLNGGTIMISTNVGRFCSIGESCAINPGRHPVNWLTTHAFPYDEIKYSDPADLARRGFIFIEPVEIGHDVWVGTRACVMGGVKVQHGAIIGFGAVVTKDVPPYAIVGGSPARVLKYRFPEKIIERLLAFRWWQFDLPEAMKAGLKITWHEPERALDELEAARLAYKLPLIGNRAIAVNGA